MNIYISAIFQVLAFFFFLGSLAAAPVWQQPKISFGSLDINGSLNQSFHLGSLSGSPEFSFPIFLEHSLRTDDPVSEYEVAQLESYVIPKGREEILWVQPGGLRTVFKRKNVLKKLPEKLEENWTAIESSPLSFEFHSADGWCYSYTQGALTSLRSPFGRELLFETSGILISRIYQKTAEKEVTLLTAKENDLGQPNEVSIGSVTHRFRYEGEGDLLIEWQASTSAFKPIIFDYNSNNLVSSVTFPSGDMLVYEWGDGQGAWQQNSGFELPDDRAGFFLKKDNHFNYQYGISREGINLVRTDAADYTDSFVFNPKTQKMTVKNRDGGEVTSFFGMRGEEYGRLESVRDARGREAVSLTYDKEGRVKTRKVPGAASLRYEYDSLRRLSSVFRLERLNRHFEYEGESQKPSVITNALGDSVYATYNEAGQVTRYQNLEGAVYEYEYDELGQLASVKWPGGYQHSIERDTLNRVVKETGFDGTETRYEYTTEGRLAAVYQGGEVWKYKYNELGFLEKLDSNNQIWEYQYDEQGVLAQLNRDGQMWQKIEREKLNGVDGEIVKMVGANEKAVTIKLDANGNVRQEVDILGNTTDYKHDKLGQLTGWKDARELLLSWREMLSDG